MTTDDGLHLLGTKPVHLVPAILFWMLGFLLGSDWLMGFAGGMMIVLLFGVIRAGAPYYRWRVDEARKSEKACEEP